MNATFKITAGLLVRRQARNYLQQISFERPSVSWIETKNILDSDFIAKGSLEDINAIEADFRRFQEEAA